MLGARLVNVHLLSRLRLLCPFSLTLRLTHHHISVHPPPSPLPLLSSPRRLLPHPNSGRATCSRGIIINITMNSSASGRQYGLGRPSLQANSSGRPGLSRQGSSSCVTLFHFPPLNSFYPFQTTGPPTREENLLADHHAQTPTTVVLDP